MWQENYLLLFRTAFLFDLDYAYLIFVRCEKAAFIKISDVAGQKVKKIRLKEQLFCFLFLWKRGELPYSYPYAKVELI